MYASSHVAKYFPSLLTVTKLISSVVFSILFIASLISIFSVLGSNSTRDFPHPTYILSKFGENFALERLFSLNNGSVYLFMDELILRSHNLMDLSSEQVKRIFELESRTSIEMTESLCPENVSYSKKLIPFFLSKVKYDGFLPSIQYPSFTKFGFYFFILDIVNILHKVRTQEITGSRIKWEIDM